jgi:hypothetical protein
MIAGGLSCIAAAGKTVAHAAHSAVHGAEMVELIRANDPVLLSFAESLLADAGFNVLLVDTHMSVMEGSIGAIPRRLLVVEDEADGARRLLREAGLAGELRDPP